jgi:hypothetical protein
MGESTGATGRGRSTARFLSLMVAGLAVAGTTPAPTRSPTIQAQGEGTIELSADHPMASVVVTVTANAALLSDPTNRTSISVTRMATRDDGAGGPIVVMAIESVDEAGAPIVGTSPSLSESVNAVCQRTGDCIRHYRITATLAGPAERPRTVGWRVAAETRTGTDASPAAPPPGSALTVSPDRQVAIDDHSALAAVRSPEVTLDPAHPRFVQPVTLVQPARGSALLVGSLQAVIDGGASNAYEQRQAIRVETMDGTPLERTGPNIDDIRLPACDQPKGCRTPLRVVGDWTGGSPASGVTVGWLLGASLFELDQAAPAKVGGLSLELGDLMAARPVPVAGTAGTIVTGGEKIRTQGIAVTIDGRGIHGSADGAGVHLQATLAATTTSKTGSTKNALFRIGRIAVNGPTGDNLSGVSELIPVSCGGDVCTATVPLEAWVYGTPADDVTLAWRLSGALVADPGITVDPDIAVRYAVVPGPTR